MSALRLLPVLVLVGHRAFAAVPEDEPFQGCKVTSGGPPTVHLACGQDVLDVTDAAAGERGGAFDEGFVVGIRQGAKPPVEQVEFSIELDGVKHRAVRIISAGSVQWVLVTLARGEGHRAMMCRETLRPDSKCHRWIEAAARWEWRAGPPASVPRDLRSPEIAGRRYQVPKGCGFVESPGGWAVTCSDKGILAWAEAPASATLSPDALIANFRSIANQERTVACSVEGVATRCWNGTGASGSPSVHVSHATEVRGKRLVVACLRLGEGSGLPSACESVLALEPVR